MRVDEHSRELRLGIRDLIGRVADTRLDVLPLPGRLRLGQQAHLAYGEVVEPGESLETEIPITLNLSHRGYQVKVSGRIDGLRRRGEQLFVEEVKSVVFEGEELASLRPSDLPLAALQVILYAFALHLQGQVGVRARVVVRALFSGEQKFLPVEWSPEELEELVRQRLDNLIDDFEARRDARERRLGGAPHLRFPFDAVRTTQLVMIEEVSEALRQNRHCLVEAPTGTGKTAVALYAVMKHAFSRGGRVVFATAKTTGQVTAEKTLALMLQRGASFLSVTQHARERMCLQPVVYCHPDFCRHCAGYEERRRRSGVLAELGLAGVVDRPRLREAGERTDLCPYNLGRDLLHQADVMIADYNYVFHPTIAAEVLTEERDSAPLFLVIDEAHNLLPRAREYQSPLLRLALAQRLSDAGRQRGGSIGRRMASLGAEMLVDVGLWLEEAGLGGLEEGTAPWEFDTTPFKEWARMAEQLLLDDPLRRVSRPVPGQEDILYEVWRCLNHFVRVADLWDPVKWVAYATAGEEPGVGLQCLDPSRALAEVFKGFAGVVAMSATLSPLEFYRDVLGLSPDTVLSSLPSPFALSQLGVFIADGVTTRLRERERHIPGIGEMIDRLAAVHPGNYAVYVPSYTYLSDLRSYVGRGGEEVLVEDARMDEMLRKGIMRRLMAPLAEKFRLILAVQGGGLAESVEWPAGVLSGVFVVGPGLPRMGFETEALRRYYEEQFGRGFEYAYLYPGMARVIQAAGRLIRRSEDRGVVVLIDERFRLRQYARTLPRYWYRDRVEELLTEDLTAAVQDFWGREDRVFPGTNRDHGRSDP